MLNGNFYNVRALRIKVFNYQERAFKKTGEEFCL